MLPGLLLALIGAADLVRSRVAADERPRGRRRSRKLAAAIICLLWIGFALLALFGLGMPAWSVLVVAGAAGLWVVATAAVATSGGAAGEGAGAREAVGRTSDVDRSSHRGPLNRLRHESGMWPTMLLAIVLVVLLVGGPGFAGMPHGFIVDWHDDSGLAFLDSIPLAALVGGVGSTLFLIDSANVVVTSALPSGLAFSDEDATGPRRDETRVRPRWWWQRGSGDRPADGSTAGDDGGVGETAPELKGGRLIGPIERLLLAGFALAGAFPIVAALIAAKGIVRFPEINRATTGNPAEYFLIGSLVSWATAFGLAGMCWLLAVV